MRVSVRLYRRHTSVQSASYPGLLASVALWGPGAPTAEFEEDIMADQDKKPADDSDAPEVVAHSADEEELPCGCFGINAAE